MAEPALGSALRAMNDALRAGDVASLAPLSKGLEDAFQSMGPDVHHTVSDLRSLRQLAEENRVLLDAVGRGLRSATARMAEITQARRGLRTYGPGGQTRSWVDPTGQGKRF